MTAELNDINEKGFLGKEIEQFTVSVQQRHSAFFDLCYQLNDYAQAIKSQLRIDNRNGQQVLATTVFLRILNGAQAVVILARVGLITDAMVVLRALVEATFILKNLCDDVRFVAEYIKSDKAHRLKLLNLAARSDNVNLKDAKNYATPEVLETLTHEVKSENLKELDIEDIARRAHLHHLYETDYRILCQPSHTSPRSVERFVATEQQGDVRGFNWGPSDIGIEYVLTTAAQFLHIALVSPPIPVPATRQIGPGELRLLRLSEQ